MVISVEEEEEEAKEIEQAEITGRVTTKKVLPYYVQ
jgi:hypothetical protein